MNESRTIGQLEVTGRAPVRTGARPETQVLATLEGTSQLSTRCSTERVRRLADWDAWANLLCSHDRASQRDLNDAMGAFSLVESCARVSPLQVQRTSFETSTLRQLLLAFHSDPRENQEETISPARLVVHGLPTRQVELISRSLSDWAKKVVITITHPDEDHLSGLKGLLGLDRPHKLASFIGRAAAVAEDVSFVTLLDESTGERLEAECDSALLLKNRIREGGEFSCTVTRKGDQTVVEFSPLPPKIFNEAQVDEVLKEVDSRLK